MLQVGAKGRAQTRHASFTEADRACREGGSQSGIDYLNRALARDSHVESQVFVADLDRALRFGSADPHVLHAVMTLHPDPERQDYAAHLLTTTDRAGDDHVAAAAIHILQRGAALALHARRFGYCLTGWLATRSADFPTLGLVSAENRRVEIPVEKAHAPISEGALSRWVFSSRVASEGPLRLDASLAGRGLLSRMVPARPVASRRRPHNIARERGIESLLTIVVPLYGDPASLATCLDALRRQMTPSTRLVLIDDASPDAEVSRLGRDFCRDLGGVYRRNPLNAGFAASVNAGLSVYDTGDVLVLNSDVVLPDGALERLVRAANASAAIGIVAPLSNDAGNTTFPDPMRPGPPRSGPDARVIDASASKVNAGLVVDLPSVLGSCFYITRACLDRVGLFSLAFGRGYFEDVDFCQRARECGFRVVAACDVYVSHMSGRSFKDERFALITRNGLVLDARFPDHVREDAAHDTTDPLRSARAAIEETLTPGVGAHVAILGRGTTARAIMDWRGERVRSGERSALFRLDWRWRDGMIEIGVSLDAPQGPRSLAFSFDEPGQRRLSAYLALTAISRIEVFEYETIPPSLRYWLASSGYPIMLVVDGHAAACHAKTAQAILDGSRIARVGLWPTDAATASCLASDAGPSVEISALHNDNGPPKVNTTSHRPAQITVPVLSAEPGLLVAEAGGANFRLGILMPTLDISAERLIGMLSRHCLVCGSPQLVILGRCIDETGMLATKAVQVTGALAITELADAIVDYDVDALFLPYRDGFHWIFEVATSRRSLARGFFDWSKGLPLGAGDLALNPSARDEEVCTSLLAWCLTRIDRTSA